MRAFTVIARALLTLYHELLVSLGFSLLWWGTGGIFVAAAGIVGLSYGLADGPWWLAPVLTLGAGPATVGLAHVARAWEQDVAAPRRLYLEAFKQHWKKGLVLGLIGAAGWSVLGATALFYQYQTTLLLRALGLLTVYLLFFWSGIQLYVYAMFAALAQPGVRPALRSAILIAAANPLYSALLILLTAALTALCVIIPVLLLVWPALVALIAEHGVRLVLIRAGLLKETPSTADLRRRAS